VDSFTFLLVYGLPVLMTHTFMAHQTTAVNTIKLQQFAVLSLAAGNAAWSRY
jgi:hypothetical protein